MGITYARIFAICGPARILSIFVMFLSLVRNCQKHMKNGGHLLSKGHLFAHQRFSFLERSIMVNTSELYPNDFAFLVPSSIHLLYCIAC